MTTKPTKERLLLVDDDKEICQLIAEFLDKHDFHVDSVHDGKQAFDSLARREYALIILDLMLPSEDGLSICRRVRARLATPIIMLTALGEETDRIVGLEMGADDYLPKPFNPRELLARIKAVLRRYQFNHHAASSANPVNEVITFAGWRLHLAKRELRSEQNVLVPLTSGEYDLLVAFVEHPQRVLSRDQLLEITKGRNAAPYDRSIDVQLSRLRRKMEDDPRQPELFKTVRSGGYLFTPKIERKQCD